MPPQIVTRSGETPPQGNANFSLDAVDLHTTSADGGSRFDSQQLARSGRGGEEEESFQIEIVPSTAQESEFDSLFDMSPSQSGKLAATALSAGIVWWASRSVGLLAALMASVPAWRTVDPLPILARDRRRNEGSMNDFLPDGQEESKDKLLAESKALLPPSTLIAEIES